MFLLVWCFLQGLISFIEGAVGQGRQQWHDSLRVLPQAAPRTNVFKKTLHCLADCLLKFSKVSLVWVSFGRGCVGNLWGRFRPGGCRFQNLGINLALTAVGPSQLGILGQLYRGIHGVSGKGRSLGRAMGGKKKKLPFSYA